MREALPRGLRELGWVEGQNVAFEFRFAEGRYDRLRDLAAELVQLKVDAIVAVGNAAATAAKNTTCAIPIVNLRTARSLGLTIPKAVLLRADQIIE